MAERFDLACLGRKKGFTLLEVLIVTIIIGVLAAIALPQYVSTIEKARSAEGAIHIGSLRSSMLRYWYGRMSFSASYAPGTLDMLDINNPNNDTGRFYNYTLTDNSTITTRSYTIRAERITNGSIYWLQWVQTDNNTGNLYKSDALGGPES
ncbi:type IV pilin protein [Candidatus Omnitrophota bacterium]